MTAPVENLAAARLERLIGSFVRRMKLRQARYGSCGHLLLDRAEMEKMQREGVPLRRIRRAARIAGTRMGWEVPATHLDAIGRLSVYDAAPVMDEELFSLL